MNKLFIILFFLLNATKLFAQEQYGLESNDYYKEGLTGVCLSKSTENEKSYKCGYKNAKGKFVIPPIYSLILGGNDDLWYLNSFNNGFVIVNKCLTTVNKSLTTCYNLGVIDNKNKIIIPFGKYDFIRYGLEKQFVVTHENGKESVIDYTGKIIVPQFDKIYVFDNQYTAVIEGEIHETKYNEKGEILKEN